MKQYVTLLIFIFFSFSAFCHSEYIHFDDYVTSPHYGRGYVGIPDSIYEEKGQINKVRFKLNNRLFVDVTRQDTFLVYQPVKYLGKDIDIPASIINISRLENPSTDIHLVNLKEYGEEYPFIWRPSTVANFDDIRLNDFPLSGQQLKYYRFSCEDTKIELVKQPHDSTFVVLTPELKKGIRDGVQYKSNYSIHDTIPLLNSYLLIRTINEIDSIVEIDRIPLIHKPRGYNGFEIIDSIFDLYGIYNLDRDKYLLLDFFGSWCKPCINGLPKLVEIYPQVKDQVNIITIDAENATEDFALSHNILAKIGPLWPIIYELIDEGLNKALKIETFPTYILVENSSIVLLTNSTDEIINFINNKIIGN